MAGISGTTYGTTCASCGSSLSAASRISKTFAETSGRNGDGTTALRSTGSSDSFYCASCASRSGSTLPSRTTTSSYGGVYGNASCPSCRGTTVSSTNSWTGGSSAQKSTSGTVNSTAWAR